ncbi:hypothetical protein [Microbulbifer sp. SSSA005]|uniref:hypothetical protein n=1 Tax=Microbulbifer sp. SSSA005 TaxID=3243378 RepID=UPI00403A3C7C
MRYPVSGLQKLDEYPSVSFSGVLIGVVLLLLGLMGRALGAQEISSSAAGQIKLANGIAVN